MTENDGLAGIDVRRAPAADRIVFQYWVGSKSVYLATDEEIVTAIRAATETIIPEILRFKNRGKGAPPPSRSIDQGGREER